MISEKKFFGLWYPLGAKGFPKKPIWSSRFASNSWEVYYIDENKYLQLANRWDVETQSKNLRTATDLQLYFTFGEKKGCVKWIFKKKDCVKCVEKLLKMGKNW